MNPISANPPISKESIMMGFPKPCLGDSVKPKVIPASPTVTNTAPQISSLVAPGFFDSGTFMIIVINTTMDNGILIKKITLHSPNPASHPPNTGPNIAVKALKVDHKPIAFPRLLAPNCELNIERLPGVNNAPPMP